MPDDPPRSNSIEAVDEPGFTAAMDELDHILAEIERDEVDVDVLAARVARASELISLCRSRIAAARIAVDQVVVDLAEPDATASGEADAEPSDPAGA